MLSRAHVLALLALLLSHASVADAGVPACDPRGMVPMKIPCEIATPSEPSHPHPLADGLLAVGMSLATVGVLFLRPPDIDVNERGAPDLGPGLDGRPYAAQP